MSGIARNIIVMGDQMQLGQPSSSHPDESGESILDYLLKGQATISPEMGIFLPKTYRMHPDLCHEYQTRFMTTVFFLLILPAGIFWIFSLVYCQSGRHSLHTCNA